MKTKKTQVYVTDDGQEFTHIGEAYRHEAWLELCAWAEKSGLCCGGEWSDTMVLNQIREDAAELVRTLAKLEGLELQ